jgi:hypothetical protein
MASAIIDCTGKVINIGDRIRTEHGDVIEVCGGLVSEHKLFNAEKCELVPQDTPLTHSGHVDPTKDGKAAVERAATPKPTRPVGDCIVWGG